MADPSARQKVLIVELFMIGIGLTSVPALDPVDSSSSSSSSLVVL
jgi:hypothetical protein